ncbi:MAG TPA: hypothetical protein VLI05_00900 [Candidatus Saccharimonadia bacterium]|nr:hypothetical protein [Candidatus Saccharimonadia bacterium]
MEFKIYQDGTGTVAGNPGGFLKWTEDWVYGSGSPDNRVTVRNGYFSVQLGSITAFGGSIDFNQSVLWLSINVGNTTTAANFAAAAGDGEMLPMKRLSSAAYALQAANSGQLGGLTSGQFVQFGQNASAQTDTGTNAAIFLNKTSTGNLLELQKGGADAFTVDNTGNIVLGSNADKTIAVATAAASTAGNKLTLQAGTGGSGTGSVGGDLVLQGGSAGGTAANGGTVYVYGGAKTGGGTVGNVALAFNGTSAVGTVGIGKAASSSYALDVSGNINSSATITGVTLTASGTLTGATVNATSGFSANGSPGQAVSCGGGQANLGAVYSEGILTTAGSCTAVQAAGNYLVQAPTSTAQNTITPATTGVVGLTVNGTNTGTAATALIVNQGFAADGQDINLTSTTGTQTNGLLVNRNGSGGTTTNGLNVTSTLGTLTTGISVNQTGTGVLTTGLSFSGTITTDISRGSGTALTLSGTSGVSIASGGSTSINLTPAGSGAVVVGGTAPTIAFANAAAAINFSTAATTTGNLLTIQGQTAGGTANNGGAVTIQGGTGTTTGTGGLLSLLGGNPTASGTNGGVTIDTGTGGSTAGTIGIGTSGIAHTINVGNNASAAQTVAVGSSNSGSSTVVQGGASKLTANNTSTVLLTSSFQIQNTGATATLLTADTAAGNVAVRSLADTGTLGGELANNTFSTTWTGTGWTLGASSATHTTGTNTLSPTTPLTVTAGLDYQITYTITGRTTGSVTPGIGGTTGFVMAASSTDTQVLVATTTGNLTFTPTTDFNGTISAVSVKVITPYGATLTVQNSTGASALQVRGSANGLQNAYVGQGVGQLNTTGQENAGFGAGALSAITTGSFNTATGYSALANNTIGNNNVAVGIGALNRNTSGSGNVAIGDVALRQTVTGSNNTAIGTWAGDFDNDNFFSANNLQNATMIGYGAEAQVSNTLILGGAGSSAVNVGIGTSQPDNTLSISSVQYSTGTASQSGTAVTGVGTTWTNAAVGEELIFANGVKEMVTAFTDATHVTASVSQTVSSQNYRLHSVGFQVTSTGAVGIGTATPLGQLHVAGAASPASTGSVTLGALAMGTGTTEDSVAVQGRYAYVVSGAAGTLQVFDVSNPAGPASVSSAIGVGSLPSAVTVVGHYAYIATYGANLLQIYDVSNPSTPTSVGSLADTKPEDVYVQGNYAYTVNDNGTMTIFDVSNAAHPVLTGTVSTSLSTDDPINVRVQGRYAYVAENNNGRVQIFDVSNPAAPTLTGSVWTNGVGTSATEAPNAVEVQGRYLYVITHGSSNLDIYDISNPASPTLKVSYQLAFNGLLTNPVAISVQSRYAYITVNSGGVLVVDVSTPTAPSLVGATTTLGAPAGMKVQGRYAYVINEDAIDKLQTFDLGGAYIQQLEVSGIEADNIATNGNAAINGDASVQGGLQVGQSLQVSGTLGVGGSFIAQNRTNSTTAFQVQNTSGASIFNIDTTNGIVGTAPTTTASTNSANLVLQSGAASGTTSNSGSVTLDSGTATGTAGAVNVGTGAYAHNVTIGNNTGNTAISIQGGSGNITLNAGNGNKIIVGSATTDTNQVLFQLDSFSTFADTATCATTTNQGALYYNTGSNAMRACINGSWEDLASTAGLGIMLFGVVPDSGAGSDPGDLAALSTTGKSGPCKVSAATASTVNIEGCVLYSGGRKRIVAANAAFSVPLSGTNIWVHICMNNSAGNENVPLATAATTETGSLPSFSVNNPIVCLADVKVNASNIVNVYDTRPFTTSVKDFVTASTAVGDGWAVIVSGSNVIPPGTVTAAQSVRGVVVASNGATSTTTPNAIIVTSGPTVVKATAGTAGAIVTQGITTNGYAITGGIATNTYSQMGYARKTFPATACTTTLNAANCDASLYFFMVLR